jgi:hypothetical protein
MSNFDNDNESLPTIEGQSAAERTEHCGPEQGGGSLEANDLSMASSVTRHTQITNPVSEPTILKQLIFGIDSLDFGVLVLWNEEDWKNDVANFEHGKACSMNGTKFIDPNFGFLHCPSGKPPLYPWHIKCPGFDAYFQNAIGPSQSTPNVFISLRSEAIWTTGIMELFEKVESMIQMLGGDIQEIKINRVDLSVDLLLENPITLDFLMKYRVPSDVKHSHHMKGNELETFYHGSPKADVKVRIYDKTKEILESHKMWFHDVWKCEATENVWRIEYQIRRKFLHSNKINTFEELLEKVADIWAYVTEKTLSLRLHDDSNTTRRSIHPFWSAVQKAGCIVGEKQHIRRTLESRKALPEWYLARLISFMQTLAVYQGMDSREKCMHLLRKCFYSRVSKESYEENYNRKTLELGLQNDLILLSKQLKNSGSKEVVS